ncbi:trypsin inhibitor-like [Fopius arisanus]|uniref:Trypsin inhibitor-like n=1 Tax=Fopius arisanus TaxID=64838 RepID=A0A9R1TFA2_9HYME|nr:PREDICTED: trypsin inhibitor-like [Fopius arisanus]
MKSVELWQQKELDMSRFVLLLVIVTMLYVTDAARNCPRGEHWNDCGGCHPTCAQKLGPPCPKICHPDCFCNKGTVRRETKGPCVKITQCPNGID